MSDLVVRRVEPADLSAVEALAKARPFTAAWSAGALAEELRRDDSLFLLAESHEVAGYALARIQEGEVRLLDFAASLDGIGLGRALWDSLLEAARKRGAAKLTLEVSSSNARALAFYEKAGAAVVGRRSKFYNDGSDAVLMDLHL